MWLGLKRRVVHQRHMDKMFCIRYTPTAEQAAAILPSVTPINHERVVAMLGIYCAKQKAAEYSIEDPRRYMRTRTISVVASMAWQLLVCP